ncbi:hypothetical protein NW752_003213 [Fusarium irregulare]|uniref:Uncharacterized protein n=1 Tax=Fusarium irregulare TaxID=2494466 RepID=A0A9W8UE94_9HYPO|nr:hypothetical protein NW766_000891 [Fusarium irregulare]KAJ4025737.1 hypothetical protein NW752_003213 [Fusarium irregulare]
MNEMPESQYTTILHAFLDMEVALRLCQAAAAGRATLAEWQRALADWQEAQATIVAISQGAEKELEALNDKVQRLNLM